MHTARATLLDDPAEWPAFGRVSAAAEAGPLGSPGPQWESHVVISGMHCAACALTLEDVLQAVPGVVSAQVNAASHRARVVWRSDAVKPSQWLAAVRRAGYDAVPAADAGRREQREAEARRMLWRWAVAGFCMMQVMMYAVPAYTASAGDMTGDMHQLLRWASWVLSLPVVLFCCGPFFSGAWRDVTHRRIGMDLPVALGMAITFVVSTAATFDPTGPLGHAVYFDSLAMFVFFLLSGRWLELRLREKTAGALEALMNRLPDSVLRRVQKNQDGGVAVFERVAVRRLAAGDVLRVLPGETFPADGEVIEGDTRADEALLSGESRPVPRPCGSHVLAGSHNLQAQVLVRVERLGAATRFAQIVRLMEDASLDKPRLAQLADRVARPFLWAVLTAATLAAAHGWSAGAGQALMLAATVLIVTCPCALSLATPAAVLAAAGTLARRGVLVRQLQGLQALAEVDVVVFDKTGTITRDGMAVTAVQVRRGTTAGEALQIAAALAQHSLHPASRALVAAAVQAGVAHNVQALALDNVTEVAGQGVRGSFSGLFDIRLGSAAFCDVAVAVVATESARTDSSQVHLAAATGLLATFDLSEDIRPDAHAAITALQAQGIEVRILSGDRQVAVNRVAAQLGLHEAARVQGGCSPAEKLAQLQRLQAEGRRVAMVGDGLNDGPVLAGAQVSFAFGSAVPLAQAQADFVVLGTQLMAVPQTLALARRTLRTVRQNLAWAAGYNAVCVPLALGGWLPPWIAGLGMAASSLLVVLNAARLARPLRNAPEDI